MLNRLVLLFYFSPILSYIRFLYFAFCFFFLFFVFSWLKRASILLKNYQQFSYSENDHRWLQFYFIFFLLNFIILSIFFRCFSTFFAIITSVCIYCGKNEYAISVWEWDTGIACIQTPMYALTSISNVSLCVGTICTLFLYLLSSKAIKDNSKCMKQNVFNECNVYGRSTESRFDFCMAWNGIYDNKKTDRVARCGAVSVRCQGRKACVVLR